MRRAAEGTTIGTLCLNGHKHEGQNASLRYSTGHCAQCTRDRRKIEFAGKAKDREIAALKRREIGRVRRRIRETKWRRAWRATNLNKSRQNGREYYKRNSLLVSLRNRLTRAFSAYSQQGKRYRTGQYGIDLQSIITHLGPCPGVRKEWHIDHIRPLSSFDFDDPQQVRKAFAPENHQWLLAQDNLIKNKKYAARS